MDIIMTGRDVDADEAFRIGLVERLASSDRFETEVAELAQGIAATAPLGNQAVKKLVRASLAMDMRSARAYSDALREPLAASFDAREGITAYRERRRPFFQGR